jgi:hypothetical protein
MIPRNIPPPLNFDEGCTELRPQNLPCGSMISCQGTRQERASISLTGEGNDKARNFLTRGSLINA